MVIKSNFFIRFLGELKITKRLFEINWHLAMERSKGDMSEGKGSYKQIRVLHLSRYLALEKKNNLEIG